MDREGLSLCQAEGKVSEAWTYDPVCSNRRDNGIVRKTLLRFTPKSPMGHIALGQAEHKSNLAQHSPRGLFWPTCE